MAKSLESRIFALKIIKKKLLKMVEIYTDGSSNLKKGDGGWAFYCPEYDYVSYGYDDNATNNKMELRAVINAIEYGRNLGEDFIVFSDSKYVVDGINKWMKNWARNQFLDDRGNDRPNKKLWLRLHYLQKEATINIEWVKGHDGNPYNEIVDECASAARKEKLRKLI